MAIKYQDEIAKERHILASSFGKIIDPLIAFLLLEAIVYVKLGIIDKHYTLLGIIAFSFMFPGRLYLNEPVWVMMQKIVSKWSFVSAGMFVIGYLTDYIQFFDDEILLNWIISAPFLMLAVNGNVRKIVKYIYAQDKNNRNVVIVGCTTVGYQLSEQIRHNKMLGMKFLGYFDDRSEDRLEECGPDDLLGDFSEVARYCNENPVDQVYVCVGISQQPRVLSLLEDLKDTTVSIYFTPDIYVTDLIQGNLSHIGGIPVVAICETPLVGFKEVQKRVVDIIIASTVLVLFSPILAWVAYKVKKSSPGPIIFVQRRYGLDGKSINVYKFRTMTVTEDGDAAYKQVTKGDSRVTKVGELLRKTSLDEFPQFINVLQGRMSVVGPRPHVVAVNETFRKLIPGYMVRHKVKPGITGWAQVNGYRGGDSLLEMQGRIEYDLEYLRKWSLALDFWIILRTALLVLGGDQKAF